MCTKDLSAGLKRTAVKELETGLTRVSRKLRQSDSNTGSGMNPMGFRPLSHHKPSEKKVVTMYSDYIESMFLLLTAAGCSNWGQLPNRRKKSLALTLAVALDNARAACCSASNTASKTALDTEECRSSSRIVTIGTLRLLSQFGATWAGIPGDLRRSLASAIMNIRPESSSSSSPPPLSPSAPPVACAARPVSAGLAENKVAKALNPAPSESTVGHSTSPNVLPDAASGTMEYELLKRLLKGRMPIDLSPKEFETNSHSPSNSINTLDDSDKEIFKLLHSMDFFKSLVKRVVGQ